MADNTTPGTPQEPTNPPDVPPTPTDQPTSPPPPTSDPPAPTPTTPTSPPPPPPTSDSSSTSETPAPPPPPPPTSETPNPVPTDTPNPQVPTDPPVVPTSTAVTTLTSYYTPTQTPGDPGQSASPTSSVPPSVSPGSGSSGGLDNSAKIAIAVVVPIAAVAILVLAGIFLWRRRKQRKAAEEQRRKEVEDYGYNPNADPTPTIPAVAAYDMREDSSAGYRGWGSTTAAGSAARKGSTAMSGGVGGAYSDVGTSPTARTVEPLVNDAAPSPEGEILGAMGPSASKNRADVRRGPSNASSSYSAAGRSDGSGDAPVGVAYGDPNQYYDQYGGGNPYGNNFYGSPTAELPGSNPPAELSGGGSSPIIRDVTARRNTRIENTGHYPQQTAGISQNF
ncbi:hypothetical protein VTJ83DRAFT_6493 [Remersonia thermophila]|uniref:Uncharacterized protein n=1 Tax=Remersonia thermophila TaxID=72144 RepID=A0ABR4D4X6_9PEZI